MADNVMAKRKMTKTQTMIYKTLHIHKNTNNDLQNTTHTKKHKQWSTKHHTYTKNTNNDLQNTTHTQKHKQWSTKH